MSKKYSYEKIELVKPEFDSELTDLVIELDHLRRKSLRGTTSPQIFFQLKTIFHYLESLESARIEGNRTTLAAYVENKITQTPSQEEQVKEIENVERAMSFIDENIAHYPINRMFLSELHRQVVSELSEKKEGDPSPGEYRKTNVKIAQSPHDPPDHTQVESYMQNFFDFIQTEHSPKYDLLKTALVHHRFVWVHPFRNGNGRTVRLLTYAMLVKQGFQVDVGRILNPTAIFCNDREKYYHYLSKADSGKPGDVLAWCEYVLKGLKDEIQKIDRLLDYDFLANHILFPAIDFSLDRQWITPNEAKILKVAVEKQIVQAGDLQPLFPKKIAAQISRNIRGLREKGMLLPERENARKYYIAFYNNYLLRGIIFQLVQNGFIPIKEEIMG